MDIVRLTRHSNGLLIYIAFVAVTRVSFNSLLSKMLKRAYVMDSVVLLAEHIVYGFKRDGVL